MTYAITSTCFVMIDKLNSTFNFMFSAVHTGKRVISKLSKGSNWVCSSLTVEIEAKYSFKQLTLS